MSGQQLAAFVRLSRPRLLLLDSLIFLAPLALQSAAAGALVDVRRLLLPALIFLIARLSCTLFDAYHDAAADAAAGAPQYRSFTLLGPDLTIRLAYAGCSVCLVLGWWVTPAFFGVLLACGLVTVLHYVLRRVRPRSLLPFFLVPALAAAQSALGWLALAPFDRLALLLFAAVFLWDVAHDAAGAVRDLTGDRAAGLATPAVRFGSRTAWWWAITGLVCCHALLCVVSATLGAWCFLAAGLPVLGLCLWSLARGQRDGGAPAAAVCRGHLETYLMAGIVVLAVCCVQAMGG